LECIKRNIPTEPNKCTKLGPANLVEDWTVFSVNTIQVPYKKELECVWCNMLNNSSAIISELPKAATDHNNVFLKTIVGPTKQ
jgi:ferredoxin-like protein FixX